MHSRNITSIAVSPNGALAITGGDASIKVWDVDTLTLLRTMHGHTDNVTSVVFLPDGQRALSASEDHSLKLWDVRTGAELRNLEGHEAMVTSLALSANGQLAIAGDLDGEVKFWDLEDGTEMLSFTSHPAGNTRVALSGDGRTFASSGADRAAVKVCQFVQGGLETRAFSDPAMHKTLAIHLALSVDGRRLLTSVTGEVLVWDVPSATVVLRLPIDDVLDLRLFGDGRRAMVATADNTIVEWDLVTGKRTRTLSAGKGEAFTSLALTPDDRRLLSGGQLEGGESFSLRLWNLDRGELVATRTNGQSAVWSAAFTPDGRRVVSACGDGSLRVWDPHAMRLERAIATPAPPTCVAISPDGRTVYAGGWDNQVHSWSLDSGAPGIEYPVKEGGSFGLTAVVASPDSRRLVGSIGYDLKVWDVTGAFVRTLKGHKDDVHALSFFPDGRRVLSASQDGTLKVWDLDAGTLLQSFGNEAANYSLFAAAVAPDGHRIAGAGSKGNIYIWDTLKPSDAPFVIAGAHKSDINALAFSTDGEQLASGGNDLTVKLWKSATGELVRAFTGHENQITTLAISPDGLQVLSSSYDESTRLWRVADGYSIALVGRQDDWLIHATDGYFDASRRGGDFVAAVQDQRAYRIDQLALTNNRPDRMMAGMGYHDEEIAAYYRSRFERRARKIGIALDQLSTSFDKVPVARIADVKIEGRTADVHFLLTDPAGKLFRYNLYVNDVPLLGALGKPVEGARQEITERVLLGPGHNKIEVSALNQSGAEALRPFRVIENHERSHGDLYVLGFGVSHYQNPKYNLGYPHKDVLDVAEVLRSRSGAFKKVHVSTWVNEQVTVDNVRKAKEFLRPAGVDDTVVLFVAGHGLHSLDAAAEYYFATYEVDPARLADTAANFELVEDLLQGIAPRQKLFLMDTCESGERDEAEQSPGVAVAAGQRGMRARSARPLVDDGGGGGAARPRSKLVFDRERYIENSLTRRSGAIVLSSSRGSEVSYEFEALQNGAFTEAILTALTSAAADTNHDGTVSTDELRIYVARRVAALTHDRQHPTVDRDNLEAKFGLPVVTAARGVVTRPDPLAKSK